MAKVRQSLCVKPGCTKAPLYIMSSTARQPVTAKGYLVGVATVGGARDETGMRMCLQQTLLLELTVAIHDSACVSTRCTLALLLWCYTVQAHHSVTRGCPEPGLTIMN